MIIFLNFNITVLFAAPTTTQVYNAAPEGLALNDYMTIAPLYNDITKNQVTIFKTGTSDYQNKSDIIQLLSATGGKNQISSVWGRRTDDSDSNDSKIDNYFNLRRKQTVSGWIYFGDKDPYTDITNS